MYGIVVILVGKIMKEKIFRVKLFENCSNPEKLCRHQTRILFCCKLSSLTYNEFERWESMRHGNYNTKNNIIIFSIFQM